MTEVAGFRVAGVSAGLKANGATDMALIVSDRPCAAAGVFTTNLMKAAPVLLDQELLAADPSHMRAVIVNTRCANACTGDQGLVNARHMGTLTARALGVEPSQVLVMSTGVIGTHLPMDRIEHGVSLAVEALGGDWEMAARGIMTTDTRPKLATAQAMLSQGTVTLTGIAKGAGMIAPNMATMLSLIVTDAALNSEQAASMLSAAAATTFNRIVIDGDMSTNDTLLLLANGASGVEVTSSDEAAFAIALHRVCLELAQAIVRDGEGATRFVTLEVCGAANDADAHQIANTIATSPLVKTALYGADANWGRIVAAAGRAGVAFHTHAARLWIAPGQVFDDGLLLFEHGMPTAYSEDRATEIVRAPEIYVRLEVGSGGGTATVYTCDLSHDYVSINGSYRS